MKTSWGRKVIGERGSNVHNSRGLPPVCCNTIFMLYVSSSSSSASLSDGWDMMSASSDVVAIVSVKLLHCVLAAADLRRWPELIHVESLLPAAVAGAASAVLSTGASSSTTAGKSVHKLRYRSFFLILNLKVQILCLEKFFLFVLQSSL